MKLVSDPANVLKNKGIEPPSASEIQLIQSTTTKDSLLIHNHQIPCFQLKN